MALTPGTQLGSYEIVSLLGAGGMGEVYRARDTRLGRDVALKTLPDSVTQDPERLARFRREAQVLAAVNHQHIASIYGLEEADRHRFLVLELVDGETLAARIERGPLPLGEAITIAREIAEALESAHEKGIVHRDLKPANIALTSGDHVKVLDFGLAKAADASGAIDSISALNSPTITSPAMLTQVGVILGTAAYMSPEQARGKAADKRTDIWAFGCVLFEMLTGQRAFAGSEVSDTLASILKSDPDWTALPPDTSPGIRRVLRRCLEKDSRRRFHDIADVRLELEEPHVREVATISPTKSRWRERVAWVVAVVSLMLLGAQAAYVRMKPAPAAEVIRFQVYPPPNSFFGGLGSSTRATNVAVSPDGTRLVFVATDRAGKGMLWMRVFDSFDALPLAGTDGASYPFWEPHGGSIGFFVGNKLKRISAAGGSPQTICDIVNEYPRGGTWGSGGDIVFSSGSSPRLYRVDADGGAPLPLATQADPLTVQAVWPYFLPDGRTFLYYGTKAREGPGVYAASIAPGAAPKKLLSERSNAAFDPSGFLLFTRGGALLRQRFDPIRLEVSGETRRVAERVGLAPEIGLAAFSVSNTGVLAFQPDDAGSTQFTWFDRTGQVLETVGPPGRYRFPAMSPDGKRLLYMDFSDLNLWILDMGRQIPSKFTTGPAPCPVWSRDAGTILYWRPIGSAGIYQKSASAAGEETLLFKDVRSCLSQVSPDGKWLLYSAVPEGESAFDIYVVPMTGDKRPQRIVQSPFEDVEPQFSPDGRFVAYSSTWTGRSEVYVQPFPTGERLQISNNGGRQPVWRSDGRELFFVNDDRKLFAVQIKPGPKFDYGTPQFLFDMRVNFVYARNSYIPSPDGQRFLVNMVLDTTSPPIHVVRNWTAGLKN